MSEADWGSEVDELAKPPKRRIPAWVWGCGAGCLLFCIVAVLSLWLVFRFASKALDQDAQWEQVAQVLALDEPPPGIHIFGLPFRIEGTSMWVMTDASRNLQAVLFQAPPGQDAAQTRSELLDASQDVSLGGFGRNEVEEGQVEVQGRTLRCLRYQSLPSEGGGFLGGFQEQMQGASIVVDLAEPESEELLALILTKGRTSERVEDDELRAFLAPFRIPGGTSVPAPPPPAPPEEGGGDDK